MFKYRKFALKKAFALFLAVLLSICFIPHGFSVKAEDNCETNIYERNAYMSEVVKSFDFSKSGETAVIKGKDCLQANADSVIFEFAGEKGEFFSWKSDTEKAVWNVQIASTGIYAVSIRYAVTGDSDNNAVRNILVDGASPYYEAENVMFYRKWQDSGDVRINSIGDEVRPHTDEIKEWQSITLYDSMGFYSTPLLFNLSEGNHVFEMEYCKQDMVIDTITFYPYEQLKDYNEIKKDYGKIESNNGIFVFQAEKAEIYRNDSTVRCECDDDPSVVPKSSGYRVLNTVGGYRWRKAGQSVTFSFDVKKSGYYKLAFRISQTWNDGLPVYRSVAIDGNVPFKELAAYRFNYDTKWQTVTLSSKTEDYLFYLDKGEHTVTMTAVLGNYTETVQSLYDDMMNLSDIVNSITRLTGSNPDPNYDYEFFKRIPKLKENLVRLYESLNSKSEYIKRIAGSGTSMSSNFSSISKQIKSMLDDPFTIAKRLEQLVQAQTSISNWYLTLQNQPLLIDEIIVGDALSAIPVRNASFFAKLKSIATGFIVSFTKDYNGSGSIVDDSVEIKESIDVWVARGTEWAETIKELADENFTPKSNVLVNMKVVPSSQLNSGSANVLLLSILSGNAPDVALGVSSGSPVEFAIRDAVVDVSKFSDFKKFVSNFNETIMIPYKYRGGVYAIPETMNFVCLFCRDDILSSYGIGIPNSRDELYNVTLPTLYQNGMQYYQTQDFSQFLFQYKGQYYTDDGMKSALDSEVALKAFSEYTEMFTHYASPVKASFFNRFRTGEMPLGIGNYSLYIQLSTSAPELTGKWSIAPLPGRICEDGTLDRSWNGISAECDIIIANERRKYKESWEFLKWWMSKDAQLSYAEEIEALIGVEARWNTANLEAFLSLDWNKSDLDTFSKLWDCACETPVVLGGYYTSRYITNAFTDVVVSGNKTVNEALADAVKAINRELKAKQTEYGVTK